MDATLVTQCLEICQTLIKNGNSFTIDVKVGSSFSFSMDSREEDRKKRMRISPSKKIQNDRRRKEYLESRFLAGKESSPAQASPPPHSPL